MSSGRIRYEQHWPNGDLAKPSDEAPGQPDTAQKQQESRHSTREGKKREVPERQPRAPPVSGSMGFDGANDLVDVCQMKRDGEIIHSAKQPSLVSWDPEPTARNDALDEWIDPELLQWQREQEQQVKEIGAAFW